MLVYVVGEDEVVMKVVSVKDLVLKIWYFKDGLVFDKFLVWV